MQTLFFFVLKRNTYKSTVNNRIEKWSKDTRQFTEKHKNGLGQCGSVDWNIIPYTKMCGCNPQPRLICGRVQETTSPCFFLPPPFSLKSISMSLADDLKK